MFRVTLLLLVSGALLHVSLVHAATIRVPDDEATIQGGIDVAVEGDTVLVASGTYAGSGNVNIYLRGRDIVLRSEAGPEQTILDGELWYPGLNIEEGETAETVIEGFTVARMVDGFVPAGGMRIVQSSPTVRNCLFYLDAAPGDIIGAAGGVLINGGSPTFTSCTISSCYAYGLGDGVYVSSGARPVFRDCVIWGNCGIDVYARSGAVVTLDCCVYGAMSTFEATILVDEDSVQDDPRFCNAGSCDAGDPPIPSNFRVSVESPCLPGNSRCGRLIGPLGVGCPPVGVEPAGGDGHGGSGALVISAFPNPARDHLACELDLRSAGRVRIDLCDPGGRVLGGLEDRELPAGHHRFSWALSVSRATMRNGIYLLRVSTEGRVESRKFIVVR